MRSRGPSRGRSDAAVEIRAEDDEQVEYLPEERAVRYVAGWVAVDDPAEGEPAERVPQFSTTPFERWAETRCLEAAARAAADRANEELGVDEATGGVTADVDGTNRAAVVTVRTVIDREGRVVSKPSVGFEALVAATPATVRARYRLGDRIADRDVPVYARSVVEWLE